MSSRLNKSERQGNKNSRGVVKCDGVSQHKAASAVCRRLHKIALFIPFCLLEETNHGENLNISPQK